MDYKFQASLEFIMKNVSLNVPVGQVEEKTREWLMMKILDMKITDLKIMEVK